MDDIDSFSFEYDVVYNFNLLEVPEHHDDLEVNLVSPPAYPVDEESPVVPHSQLSPHPARVTPVLLTKLLQTERLPVNMTIDNKNGSI